MGASKPKPDFAVGLQRSAFEDGELSKLENYSTPQGPFLFTPNLSFPFLICEAKTGQTGINKADTQNIHSASIAVRAILRLYNAAYGRDHEKTQALLGRILVFSVSHNNQLVNLYGHYAVASSSNDKTDGTAEELQYFRYGIAMFSLTMYEGRDRYNAYNFIRNVYDKFASEIWDGYETLSANFQALRSGRACPSQLNDDDSQQDSEVTMSQDDSGFKTPGEPASVSLRHENRKIREQMDKLLLQLQKQREDSEQQRKESKEQLQRQGQESKGQMDKLLKQLEEQRKDSEQQRKESKEQLDRLLAMVTGSKRIES
ncbi:hypothetical protein LTS02_017603 [Friedmanniomyces endolithicus]|nr:hypothetical protein LTR94_023267 [Friedmanniomyces endolithicus]KAK0768171.1 hypothetical protein LTR59_017869 [Friedmanniomyces endolithicus]KAK0769718.1 hypothetical protein LTR38_017798 [Friedmanniomyces endolithicus]KAK0770878.1 hypothetical protein LTR75_017806 [Friedmanniomyces endolithicus]KAK0839038.1 hypothetical protein LTS02_017603 [Friedmanniomyces endolithicus]